MNTSVDSRPCLGNTASGYQRHLLYHQGNPDKDGPQKKEQDNMIVPRIMGSEEGFSDIKEFP